MQCIAIRRRTMLFYSLLARLDSLFLPFIHGLEQIVAAEGTDYRAYSQPSKRIVASAASVAVSVKAVLDTPLLSDAGELTEISQITALETAERIQKLEP